MRRDLVKNPEQAWKYLQELQSDPGHVFTLDAAYRYASILAGHAVSTKLPAKHVLYPRPIKLTQYQITVGEHILGTVFREVTSSSRKAGRLIAATFHPIEWSWATSTLNAYPVPGLTYRTRGRAIEALCYQWVIVDRAK